MSPRKKSNKIVNKATQKEIKIWIMDPGTAGYELVGKDDVISTWDGGPNCVVDVSLINLIMDLTTNLNDKIPWNFTYLGTFFHPEDHILVALFRNEGLKY